jgi:putative isomerase
MNLHKTLQKNTFMNKVPNATRTMLSITVAMLLFQFQSHAQVTSYPAMETAVFQGWNTWDPTSMTSHVLAPDGFEIGLVFKSGSNICQNVRLSEVDVTEVGPHAYDGSYTEVQILWYGLAVELQTAVINGDWVALITPLSGTTNSTTFTPTFTMAWGDSGTITNNGSSITAVLPTRTIQVFCTYNNINSQRFTASSPLGLSTGSNRSLATIEGIISTAKTNFVNSNNAPFGADSASVTAHSLMQTALAWQVQYDPSNSRVITTVSRDWSVNWGGWVLFDWDSYFTAYMLGMDDKYLAYGNAIAITEEEVPGAGNTGFIPNYASGIGTSTDRSQPPVGSLVCWELYRKYQETWFLQTVYPNLLAWNRWWPQNRDASYQSGMYNTSGLLSWGSDSLQDAMYESGMDDSPMYGSTAGFNSNTGMMQQYDVGLMGEYISDCKRLAKIAAVLGYPNDQTELLDRAAYYQAHMPTLWNSSAGMFMNQSSTNGQFNANVSPTCFYAMLAGAATPAEVNTMMGTYFYNTNKFWGTWILPSITIDNPAYPNQQYWEGDIWAPLNLLVYLGAQNYGIPQVRSDISQKSVQLFNNVGASENYYATTGTAGGQIGYVWGSLLGFIGLIQNGYMNAPDVLTYSDSFEFEAENATLTGGAAVATNNTGYSATGFVDGYYENTTADTNFSVNVSSAGQYTLAVRYSAGNGTSTNTALYVNGVMIQNLTCNATADWDTWAYVNEQVTLNSGANTIELKSTASTAACINIDYITVTAAGPTLSPIAAVSRMTHGSTGTFDIPISVVAGTSPASGTPPDECRNGTTLSLVVTFNKAIASGNAAIAAGTATVGTPIFSGATMTIPLTNVANAQEIQVNLTGLQASDGSTLASAVVTLGELIGDINGDGVVSAADLIALKGAFGTSGGQSGFNPRADLNVDGVASAADLIMLKNNFGISLP